MSFKDLYIIGIDETRPPMLQTRPCIDLMFELNEQAPEDWCKEFQIGVGKQRYSYKIDPEEGLFIETWVREPIEMEKSLELAKALVTKGNGLYRARLAREAGVPIDEDVEVKVTPEQIKLNEMVAKLNFD